jgi:hypothetical protein
MKKKEYIKPKLDTYEYAQFENVFTACGKVKNQGCGWVTDPSSGGDIPSNYSAYSGIGSV